MTGGPPLHAHLDEAVRAVVDDPSLGRLDGWVLAEGLETLAELRACVDLGVPLGQGYLLGRPDVQRATEIPAQVATAIAHRVGAQEFVDTLAPLLARISESTSDVARRVTTRDVGCRFDPIVCRDGTGRYQGIVTIDRLLRRLAE